MLLGIGSAPICSQRSHSSPEPGAVVLHSLQLCPGRYLALLRARHLLTGARKLRLRLHAQQAGMLDDARNASNASTAPLDGKPSGQHQLP